MAEMALPSALPPVTWLPHPSRTQIVGTGCAGFGDDRTQCCFQFIFAHLSRKVAFNYSDLCSFIMARSALFWAVLNIQAFPTLFDQFGQQLHFLFSTGSSLAPFSGLGKQDCWFDATSKARR